MLKGKGILQGPFTALSAEFEDTLLNLWGVKQNPEQTEDKKVCLTFSLEKISLYLANLNTRKWGFNQDSVSGRLVSNMGPKAPSR